MKPLHFGTIFMRGQLLHEGHIHLIERAVEEETKLRQHHGITYQPRLLILVGSANQRSSIKNPFSFEEVRIMLRNTISKLDIQAEITILPLNDYRYMDNQWMLDVQQTVKHYLQMKRGLDNEPVDYAANTIYGHNKDESSSYLKWFPEWKFVEVGNHLGIDATDLRAMWLANNQQPTPEMRNKVPYVVRNYLGVRNYNADLQADWHYYTKKEPDTFASYPYPVNLNFSCADMVVECAGHIALVQRKNAPGRGCWALPGGFKNQDENFVDCAVREFFEELDPKISERVLRKSIVKTQLFDDPNRSFGIPRHTLAVYAKIDPEPNGKLPKLRPMDDAINGRWVPIEQALNEMKLYDDHGDIIMAMTGLVPKPAYLKH